MKNLIKLCFVALAMQTFCVCPLFAFQQKNSTKKIRVKPSPLANRIGMAIKWEKNIEDAVVRSQESGKPIFWYVPTVSGSFMDRRTEIDRYMMAGPFSWPEIIDSINQRFVPVKAKPSSELQKRFGLQAFKFVEPGFLVIDAEMNQKMKVDRLTTLHRDWFHQLVLASIDLTPEVQRPKELATAWERASGGEWTPFDLVENSDENQTEKWLFNGMAHFRNGRHEQAKKAFEMAAASDPRHPLAWKAAAEAEGFGPFVRGFEVFRKVDASALNAGIKSAGSAAPQGSYTEDELWKRGVDFLLGMQNDQGGFEDSDYDFGGTDSLPNVHVAITALVGLAFDSANEKFPNYRAGDVTDAIKKCVSYVMDDRNINVVDRDEIMWAYTYRTRLLARLSLQNEEYKPLLANCVRTLQNVQSQRGGWYHEYENPFVTATALTALHDAQMSGAVVDRAKIEAGLSSLGRDRNDNGSFPYSTRTRQPKKKAGEQQVSASAGRMPLCEMGLFAWGRSDDQKLAHAISKSFEYQDNLNVALKYDDHTSRQAYGGFFFWYDMRARTEAISMIADEAVRNRFHAQQVKIVLSLPELDGCFVDSHEIGRCYGTAMALLCLSGGK